MIGILRGFANVDLNPVDRSGEVIRERVVLGYQRPALLADVQRVVG